MSIFIVMCHKNNVFKESDPLEYAKSIKSWKEINNKLLEIDIDEKNYSLVT